MEAGGFETGSVVVDADTVGATGLKNETGGVAGCVGVGGAADAVDGKPKLKGLLAGVAAG